MAANAIGLGKREQGVRQAGAVAVVVSAPPEASLGIQDGSELFFFSIVETKFQQLWNKQGCQCRQFRQGFRQKRIRCATVYRLSGFPTNHPPL